MDGNAWLSNTLILTDNLIVILNGHFILRLIDKNSISNKMSSLSLYAHTIICIHYLLDVGWTAVCICVHAWVLIVLIEYLIAF